MTENGLVRILVTENDLSFGMKINSLDDKGAVIIEEKPFGPCEDSNIEDYIHDITGQCATGWHDKECIEQMVIDFGGNDAEYGATYVDTVKQW